MHQCLFVAFVLFLGPVLCDVGGLINGTEIERLYSKLFARMIRVLEDQVEMTGNPSPEDEDRISCIYGLNALFKNLGSSWGLAMIDSASKLPSGIMSWNFMDLGEYDQCLKVSVRPTEDNPHLPIFKGRHCLITNRIYTPNGTIKFNGKQLALHHLFHKPYIPLTIAQCYPSLCKPYVIQEGLNGVLSLSDHDFDMLGLGFGFNVTVDPKDCHDAQGIQHDVLDWTVLVIILLFLFLGLISTGIDFYFRFYNINPSSDTMRLLGSFSFYTNTKRLFSCGKGADVIPILNGLKFISMGWIVFLHRVFFLRRQSIKNFNRALASNNILTELPKMVVWNSLIAVDTFFFISGTLNMYGFLKERINSKHYTFKDLLNGYIHRYIRLTPAYLIMMGFTATWLYHLRDGPLWDRFVGPYKDDCRQHYWLNIFYLNNYLGPRNYCMIQSWYLAVDMQLYWLSPFVMYPLWKWPKYGGAQLLVLTAASIISPFLVSWYGHIPTPALLRNTNEIIISNIHQRDWELSVLYQPTHTRFVSYVIGIGAGCIIFHYRKGSLSLELNLWKRTIGWLLSATLMLYALFGGYKIYRIDYKYNQLLSAFYIGFHRFFWSAGLLLLVLLCIKGYGGLVNSFLSWKVFTPLAKITYGIYLTHIVILVCSIEAKRNSFYLSGFDQLETFLGDMVLTVLSGMVLNLLVETPMLNVDKILFGGGRKIPTDERGFSSSTPTKLEHLNSSK